MSQERRITIDRTTIGDLMPFFVGISKELIAQDRVETDLQAFVDNLGTLQRDIGDFLNQLPDYLDKYKRLQEEKQALNRKIEAQKKEAAELDAKLKAEFGVGEQPTVFDTIDILGMLSTPTDKAYHDSKNGMNALASNSDSNDDDDEYGSGYEDQLGGKIGAVDDAGRPIDPYMDMDDRLTDEMLRERQDTAVQRSEEHAKAAAKKTAAAKTLAESQHDDDSESDYGDYDGWDELNTSKSMNTDTDSSLNQADAPKPENLDDMFGLDDDDDDLMGAPIPMQNDGSTQTDSGASSFITGFGDDDDLDDDDF